MPFSVFQSNIWPQYYQSIICYQGILQCLLSSELEDTECTLDFIHSRDPSVLDAVML